MAAANWLRYAYLAYASRPKSERELYRLVKRHQVCRIVEIGVSDLPRTVSLVQVAQRYAGEHTVSFTGIDSFDARPRELAPMLLKETYRTLRATGANVRLVPGSAAKALAAAANAHQNTDLILVASHVTDQELEGGWFYVPRMLHDETVILRERREGDGLPVFSSIPRAQVAEWAGRDSSRRAA